jgi:hypothetical protein
MKHTSQVLQEQNRAVLQSAYAVDVEARIFWKALREV